MHPLYPFSSSSSIFLFHLFHTFHSFSSYSNLYHVSQQCSAFFFLVSYKCNFEHPHINIYLYYMYRSVFWLNNIYSGDQHLWTEICTWYPSLHTYIYTGIGPCNVKYKLFLEINSIYVFQKVKNNFGV